MSMEEMREQIRRRMGVASPQVDVIVTVLGGQQSSLGILDGGGLVGFRSSANPPDNVPIGFIDWPFEQEDVTVERHVDLVRQFEPKYATAPDVQRGRTLDETVRIGDRLSQWAEHVLIVPKEVAVADVPGRFLAAVPFREEFVTPLGVNNFADWHGRPVHILGGNPTEHFTLRDRFQLDVISVDSPNPLVWADNGRVWVGRKAGANGVRSLLIDRVAEGSFEDPEVKRRRIRRQLLTLLPADADDLTLNQILQRSEITQDLPAREFILAADAEHLQEQSAEIGAATGLPTWIELLESRRARVALTVKNLLQAWNEGGAVTELSPVAPGRGPPPPAPEGLHGEGRAEVLERFMSATMEEQVGQVEQETERGLAMFERERRDDDE